MTTLNISVLIPSYNEAKTIGYIVKNLKLRGLTVYVVDDGSLDGTASIARDEGAVVVRHEVNRGKGASLREGFRHILKKNYDAVLTMDGDNQHEIDDVDLFLKKMEEAKADVIIGDRMSDTTSMPRIRILVNRFMSDLISKISGQYIPDTQCGFRLIKIEVLKSINLESSNYEIESEMIIRTAQKGFKIVSVPIKTIYNDETSNIRPIVDTLRFIALMAKLMLKR